MALLAAVALAVVPATAYADVRDRRPDHGERGERGDRGRGGGEHARATPAQAPQPRPQHGSGMMATPRSAPDNRPAPPQAQPQFRREARSGWQGGGRDRPQMATGVADNRLDRSQWRPGANRGNDGRSNDTHRWDGNRGQWNGNDRRSDAGNDHHRGDKDNRGQWGNGGHRWDNGNHRDNDDHRWNRRPTGNGHHWDSGRWRNDHRYDWRGWRNSHHNLFRRHYYAPRGYHHRSVYAGFFLEPLFYGAGYWLDNPYDDYRLPPAEWPLRWIHYYNDALLVDVTTGEVVDVIPNFFF
jgi:hypothetical protein